MKWRSRPIWTTAYYSNMTTAYYINMQWLNLKLSCIINIIELYCCIYIIYIYGRENSRHSNSANIITNIEIQVLSALNCLKFDTQFSLPYNIYIILLQQI